jgi:hypothetical protein
MDTPQVNKIELQDHDAIKAAVTLGFASDPLLRFFFDAPHKYLRSFSEFMNEFLSLSIPAGGAYADNNFSGGWQNFLSIIPKRTTGIWHLLELILLNKAKV